jgi:hypothetical protein
MHENVLLDCFANILRFDEGDDVTTLLEAQKVRVRDRGDKELSVPVGLERVVLSMDHEGRDSDISDARAGYFTCMVEDRARISQRSRVHPFDKVPNRSVLFGAESVYDSFGYPHEPHELPLEQSAYDPIREVSLEDPEQCATLPASLLAHLRWDLGTATGDECER